MTLMITLRRPIAVVCQQPRQRLRPGKFPGKLLLGMFPET